MKEKNYFKVFLIYLLLNSVAHAKIFSAKRVLDLAPLNDFIDTEIQKLEDSVNNGFPNADASTYLSGMANAGVMSVKGLGGDYTNDFSLFSAGVKLGLGVDLGDNSFSDVLSGKINGSQARGFAFQPAITLGLNMGIFPFLPEFEWMSWDKLRLHSHFFFFDLGSLGGSDFSGEISSMGARLSYQFYDSKNLDGLGLVRWGGITVQTGFEVMKLKLTMKKTVSQNQEVTAPGPTTVNIKFSGDAFIDVETSSFSIPIEISTNIRLLYALTMYGGFGLDINSGKSTGSAGMQNTSSQVVVGGTPANNPIDISLGIGQEGKSETFFARSFAGLQFNIAIVKVFMHVQKSLNAGVWGANLGLNIAW